MVVILRRYVIAIATDNTIAICISSDFNSPAPFGGNHR